MLAAHRPSAYVRPYPLPVRVQWIAQRSVCRSRNTTSYAWQLAETEAKLIHARDPDRKPLMQRRDALEARIQALEDGHLVNDLPPAIESTGTIPSRRGSDGEKRR